MTYPSTKMPAHKRFNNLCEGDTLDRFEWFELVACRTDQNEVCVIQCEAGKVEFWSIYGRSNEGTEEQPEYLATAIHDAWTPLDAVRIARQIAIETGNGFVAGDTVLGHFPTCIGIGIWPVTQFRHIADDIKNAIREDLESTIAPEDLHKDDDDTHPLAVLRDAFFEFSDCPGRNQRDPYAPIKDQTIEQVQPDQDGEASRGAALTLTFYKLTTDCVAGINSVIFTEKQARDDALLEWAGSTREDWLASNLAHDLDAFVKSKTDLRDRFKTDQATIDITGLITVNQAWVYCKDEPGSFGNLYDPDTVMSILEERPDPMHPGDLSFGFDPGNARDRAAVLAWCEQNGPDFEDQISELVCRNFPTRTAAYTALAEKNQTNAAK
ncbi:hypothetical protein [uncultured Ruegeria sp.]|uniref:hypothetical protein n=1 Tax=uncultured Ruegeria sp. TaxID=259304 RepID=UPI0026092051|nr:hypothetical protein [uncultured Ruegeria sp.]